MENQELWEPDRKSLMCEVAQRRFYLVLTPSGLRVRLHKSQGVFSVGRRGQRCFTRAFVKLQKLIGSFKSILWGHLSEA